MHAVCRSNICRLFSPETRREREGGEGGERGGGREGGKIINIRD